jgi:Na+/H+ antiporter NhaC
MGRSGSRSCRVALAACCVAAALSTIAAQETLETPATRFDGPPPIHVSPPTAALTGVPVALTVSPSGYLPADSVRIEVRDAATGHVADAGELAAGGQLVLTLEPSAGDGPFVVHVPGHYREGVPLSFSRIPGWLAILPPVVAILLALIFRQVVPALLAGVWVGAWIAHGGPFVGVLRTVDRYGVGALNTSDHVSIVIFTLLLGGMVGVISRAGGTIGLVDSLRPYATNSRRGQFVTWLLGILIFFDDYANTLLVGNTMRPVTDRLRISREKLAYIVDSTAAPVASIALVSTWIGYEVSLIGDSLDELGSDLDAYNVFLRSLPYNFYPILALVFGLLVALTLRDFGAMRGAERRAREGKVLADTAEPLADFDNESLRAVEGRPRRWFNAVLPVGVVLLVTFLGLWSTGRTSLTADGDPLASLSLFDLGIEGIGGVFGAGNSFQALLWGSLAGCLVAFGLALGQRILSLGESLAAWMGGMRSMMLAMIILLLAWSIADVCADLNTSVFMVANLSNPTTSIPGRCRRSSSCSRH